jgi:hypothetical protein
MNGLVMEQQDDTTKQQRAQFAQTLSISHPIGSFTVSGEVWHFAQPLAHSCAAGNLLSASYSVEKNLVVDVGFDHGFTSTFTHWGVPVSRIFCPIDFGANGTVFSDSDTVEVHHAVS